MYGGSHFDSHYFCGCFYLGTDLTYSNFIRFDDRQVSYHYNPLEVDAKQTIFIV